MWHKQSSVVLTGKKVVCKGSAHFNKLQIFGVWDICSNSGISVSINLIVFNRLNEKILSSMWVRLSECVLVGGGCCLLSWCTGVLSLGSKGMDLHKLGSLCSFSAYFRMKVWHTCCINYGTWWLQVVGLSLPPFPRSSTFRSACTSCLPS